MTVITINVLKLMVKNDIATIFDFPIDIAGKDFIYYAYKGR